MSSSSISSAEAGRPRAGAIVVAAGAGRRMGGVRKQYLELAGEPVLLHTLRPFRGHPDIRRVVVVLPPDDLDAPPEWLRSADLTLVGGGAERADSVWNGLHALPADTEVVLIHDGARPLVPPALVDRVLEGARREGVVAAVRVTDTIKRVGDDGRIVETVDRTPLWRAQTPQGFPYPALLDVHRRAREEGVHATDDAALFERYGLPVRIVEGADENLKLTRPGDLRVAEALARGRL